MKISKASFCSEALGDQQHLGCSKKSVQQGPQDIKSVRRQSLTVGGGL